MNWEERIELNPAVLAGKPTVRGTRIAVELVIERLNDGWDEETILAEYPSLDQDDIGACRRHAARSESLDPTP